MTALVLACLLHAASPAFATDPASPRAEAAITQAGAGWTARVDAEHGFYDGEPTVPDATITYLPGRDLPRALKASFPVDARTEPLTFGHGRNAGLRATSPHRTPDGVPYDPSGYLIAAPGGTFRIGRYESFAWAPFDAAARSFRFVHLVPSDTRD